MINITTNSNLKLEDGKGPVDMCLAIQEMMADSKAEGEIKGAVETCRKLNLSLQETIKFVAENFNFSLEQAGNEVEKYW